MIIHSAYAWMIIHLLPNIITKRRFEKKKKNDLKYFHQINIRKIQEKI